MAYLLYYSFHISVEDPTDNCQVIRDYVDLCRCERLNIFSPENLKNGFTKDMEVKLREELKIHKVRIPCMFRRVSLISFLKAPLAWDKFRILSALIYRPCDLV